MNLIELPNGHHLNPAGIFAIHWCPTTRRIRILPIGQATPIVLFDDEAVAAWQAIDEARSPAPGAATSALAGLEVMCRQIKDLEPAAEGGDEKPVAKPEPIDLHSTLDAKAWASEFCRIVGEKVPGVRQHEDWIFGWFANAIMKGFDAARSRYDRPEKPAVDPESIAPEAGSLAEIADTIRDYHFALDNYRGGASVTADALRRIEDAMGMPWVEGREKRRREQAASVTTGGVRLRSEDDPGPAADRVCVGVVLVCPRCEGAVARDDRTGMYECLSGDCGMLWRRDELIERAADPAAVADEEHGASMGEVS